MARVLRWLFVVLLAASGIAKLADMRGFIDVVGSYRGLPASLLAPAAWGLALLEVAIAAWLASGQYLRAAASMVVLLHITYLVWVGSALARGLELVNCGCFGVFFARPLGWTTLLEDSVLLAMALLLLRSLSAGAMKALRGR